MTSNEHFRKALSSNEDWASKISGKDTDYFPTMSKGQTPHILWLGCSDSRVPETTVLGLGPGDVFVHRNIANIISPQDINSSAVIEYAVAYLKVDHVVLCGHTSCGGAAAALSDAKIGGVLDAWLTPLRVISYTNKEELAAIQDQGLRARKLAEMNVAAGVNVLKMNKVIIEAMEGRGLEVHGCIYDIACGKVCDLSY